MGDQDRSKLGNDRAGSQRIRGPREADRTKTIRKKVCTEIVGLEVRSDTAYNPSASDRLLWLSLTEVKITSDGRLLFQERRQSWAVALTPRSERVTGTAGLSLSFYHSHFSI